MKIAAILILVLITLSCKKAENRSCFKINGAMGTKTIELDPFNRIELGPRIKYVLVQDTLEKLVIIGGENLLNFISADISEGILTVKNENKCNFLRSYRQDIVVEIHLKSISYVIFEGTKDLTCESPLLLDNLIFVIRDGAGHCDLNVLCDELDMVVTSGWGNFNLSGQVNYLRMDIRSNGHGSAYDLHVNDSLNIISKSSELVKINSDGIPLRAEIGSYGSVWYIGNPSWIEYNRYGEGELINNN